MRSLWTLLVSLLGICLLAAPVVGQSPSEAPVTGISIGAFLFNSGLRPGIVVDRPLEWNAERGAAFEAWASLVPDSGVGAALGVRVGSGVLRGGLGLVALRASGDFGVGPGFHVGLAAPVTKGDPGTRLHGSFHAYFTNEGYVPLLRITLGSWSVGDSGRAS